jgi:hypothetical protein
LDDLRKKAGTNDNLDDDEMPSSSLRYSADMTVMEWRYDYALKSGGTITHIMINETPYYLLLVLRKNPDEHAHIAEKECDLMVESIKDSLFSEAEQAAEHAKATQSSLWEKVKGRNVSDWRECEGSEIAEILSQLDPRCQMWRENTGRSALTRRRRAALFPGPVWPALLRDDPIKVAIH